jgi:hypothetical protein
MTDWFRSWHGAPTDPKWRTIARRASVRPGDVFAVISCLWDRASQAQERGSIAGYDCEIIADGLGYDPDEVVRIIGALADKGVIAGDRIVAWEKYQPKREDEGAADRAKQFRERNRTHPNAPELNRTTDTDKRREDNTPLPPEAGGDESDAILFREKVWDTCPKHPGSVMTESYAEFSKLDAAGKAACIAGAARLRRAHDEMSAGDRPAPIAKKLSTWISKRGWEGWPDPSSDPQFVVIDQADPLVPTLNAARSSPFYVGKSGKITVPKAEYERAISGLQEIAA